MNRTSKSAALFTMSLAAQMLCGPLNNLIEQDHRAIKRRCASMTGFKSFRSAAITLAGIELAHRIRKRQFALGRGRYRNFGSLKQIWDRALA
jgi:transposase-like protein